MRITYYVDVEAKEFEGSSKLKIRWLNDEGSRHFAVRHIEIESDGYSPYHRHSWEHEIFVLEGNGAAVGEKEEVSISVGDLVSISANEVHQIKNNGEKTLRLLCMIPK